MNRREQIIFGVLGLLISALGCIAAWLVVPQFQKIFSPLPTITAVPSIFVLPPTPTVFTITPPVTDSLTTEPPITEQPTAPHWVSELLHSTITPGVGMAGLKLGDLPYKVYDTLGLPTLDLQPVPPQGNTLYYVMNYMQNGLVLGFNISKDQSQVIGFRLLDDSFNGTSPYGSFPEIQGVTLGSTESDLINAFGQPIKSFTSDSCTGAASTGGAITYSYNGISFTVCNANKKIFFIDIPSISN